MVEVFEPFESLVVMCENLHSSAVINQSQEVAQILCTISADIRRYTLQVIVRMQLLTYPRVYCVYTQSNLEGTHLRVFVILLSVLQ